ncbi:aminopeptidase NAALADL1 isoform X4 [Mustela putorius furo]|uniref:Aminopeptidase NAALADL1 isoform X4 n=1 Tax=Mustela putorius furo TaxID=9669 RepID=A0A8U0RA09_MUSPF|nr:aminopeptidase NAALADL1 isoform X4 [Mustela putorius furo]
MQWVKVLGGVVGAAALLGLGIILGHFAIPKGANVPAPSVSQDLDLEILETVMQQLEASRIRENLRELSREPHLASSPRDEALVQLLLQRWQDPESGLDAAEAPAYEVLLSFPSQEQPNHVAVVSPTGSVVFSCRQSEQNLTGEQVGPDVVPPYAAYAPPGTPQGLLVYANRGTEEDFMNLQTQGIKLEGTIALTRYGGAGRGAKAVNAAKYGVAGVLVYTDPADINDGQSSANETFPNSWCLPPSGVERGSYYEYFGDPLTPYLPANPSSFRLDPDAAPGFPPIPAQPIGFDDAKSLLWDLWPQLPGREHWVVTTGWGPASGLMATSQQTEHLPVLSWGKPGKQLCGPQGPVEFHAHFTSDLHTSATPSLELPSSFPNQDFRTRCSLCLEHPSPYSCHSWPTLTFPPATSQVNVSVHNRRELRNSSNVLGIIRGAVEPDRYVLYGNHRDSWVHGAVDPSSGTAVLLELSRVLGTLLKKGTWRPRRSIVFASWGAEEFGLIGSTEFTEEFFSKLQERTVAYINVDISVFANATLRAQGTPPVQSVIFAAAKQIPAPSPVGLSIYDNWIRYSNRSSPAYGVVPSLGSLGAGSDYAPFIHFLGISSMDIAYTYDRPVTLALFP